MTTHTYMPLQMQEQHGATAPRMSAVAAGVGALHKSSTSSTASTALTASMTSTTATESASASASTATLSTTPTSSTSSTTTEAGPKADLRCVRNPGGGDCLFYAICHALVTYSGSAAERLRTQLQAVGLNVPAVTATELRRMAYSLFLLPNLETDEIMARWQAMVTVDPELAVEYGQARCLIGKDIGALSVADRTQFFVACMDPRITWGDEFTLYFLERLLQIRCMVLYNGTVQLRQYGNHGDDFSPIVYVLLQLHGSHYEAVVDGSARSAFARAEIPAYALALVRRDCHTAKEGYINLADDGSSVPLLPSASEQCVRLQRHYMDCKTVADTVQLPERQVLSSAIPRYAAYNDDVDADMVLDADMNTEADADAKASASASGTTLVDLNGSYIPYAVMPHTISRLQCGMPTARFPEEGQARAAAPSGLPFATRLLNRQPVNVW